MDTCFLSKETPYFSVHRDLGYLCLVFFPMPNGASDTCFDFFFLLLWPIGAVDTCFDFFFSRGPSGHLVDGNMVL